MLFIPQTPNVVDGGELHRALAELTARERAIIALNLETGALRLSGLTRSQAIAIAEVSRSTVARVQCPQQQPPTDAAVERAIKRLGLDRVLRALDRLTAPMMRAAE